MYAFCERVRARERRPWGFLCILEARVCHAASTQHARSSAPSDVLCPRARDARCLRIMDAPKLKQAVVSAKTGVNVCGFDSGTKRRQPPSSSGNALPLHTHTLSQSRTRTSACAGSRHQSAYVRQRGARHAPAEDSPTPRLPIPERGAAQSSAVLCVVRREQWRAVRATRARRSQHRPPAALAPRETDHPPAPPASRTDRRPIHPKARQVQAGTGQPQTGGPCSTFGNSLRSARPCRSTTYARTPIVLASVATSRVRHARRRRRALSRVVRRSVLVVAWTHARTPSHGDGAERRGGPKGAAEPQRRAARFGRRTRDATGTTRARAAGWLRGPVQMASGARSSLLRCLGAGAPRVRAEIEWRSNLGGNGDGDGKSNPDADCAVLGSLVGWACVQLHRWAPRS